jgi:hypothetical protein
LNQTELVDQLRELTGDLQPGDAGPDALHEVRRRLAASLRGAAAPSPAQPAAVGEDVCLEPRLKLAIAESSEEVVPAGSQLALMRRGTPLVSPILSAQAAARPFAGQASARTFGPFVDMLGRKIWFDEFRVGPTLHIKWAEQPGVALVLPQAVVLPGALKLDFAAGSIWMAARALATSAPAGAYAGWKIQHATLALSAAGTLSGNTLTLPANATCHLTLVLDNSEIPAPPPGPGVDAGEASLGRPKQAEMFFSSNGLTAIHAGSAELQIFGHHVVLDPTNAAPTYDASLERVWIPFAPHPQDLADLTSHSTLCTITGKAKVDAAGWCPTLSTAAPAQLGDAGSGGMLVLAAGGALIATSAGLQRGPLRLGRSYFLLDRGMAGVLAPLAENRTAAYSFSLWDGSTFHLAMDEPFAFLFLSSRLGFELAQYRGTLTAALEQPKQADGNRLALRFSHAKLNISQSDAGVSTFGSVSDPSPQGRTALALSNGLFTVTPALQMDWSAQLSSPSAAQPGSLQLLFGIYQLLPILPDPYAANFDPSFLADAPRGRLQLRISWGLGEPQLAMTILSGHRPEGSPEILPVPGLTPVADSEAQKVADLFQRFVHGRAFAAEPLHSLRLLDVSTNADQLGVDVSYIPGLAGAIQAQGVDLVSLGGAVDVLMLPQMQWEPVQVVQNKDVGTLPDYLASPDDGGPTFVGGRTVRLVPIAPMPITTAVVEAHNSAGAPTGALFTLPFGIRAVATLDPTHTPPPERAGIQLFRKAFVDSFTSATQVRLTAAPARVTVRLQHDPQASILVREPPLLPGAAVQTVHWSDLPSPAHPAGTPIVYTPPPSPPPPPPPVIKNPPFSVLDPIDADFNNTFGHRVPIERIDLSGYGASCFSDWWDDQLIGITNVRFEVLTGRTRYEVIQMRSILVPCHAVVVRTITLERRAGGNVYRWDSGWQPVTDGLFESSDSSVVWHTGVVRGFYNIRRIRDTPGTIPLDNGRAEVEAVYFDTDIEFNHIIKGATSGKRVSSVGQLGFVQRIPLKIDAAGKATAKVDPLNPVQLHELLNKFDPVGGAVDCAVDIGGSGQQMRITGVYCSPAPKPGGREFAVAAYGSLVVPRNEQWSVVRVTNDNDVSAVDAQRGVPLVRLGGTPHHPPSGNYRIADPGDLLNPNPAADYGLQLTTRTNRLLFRRPEIPDGGTRITGALPPVLADPYSLAGCGGLFPPLQRCIHLDAASYALDIIGGVFRWNTPAANSFTIPELGPSKQRFLIKSDAFDLLADYSKSTVELAANQSTPWAVNIPQVPAVLNVKTPFSAPGILQVVNDLFTPDTSGLVLKAPQVQFGGILDEAQNVITALRDFLPDVPPITIDLSTPRLDDPGLRLLIAARFPIAQADGSAIDIGIGKFRGEIGIGTEVRLTLASFGGRIYFMVSGELQQALLPDLLYVGGGMQLEISIDESAKPAVRLVTSAVASVGGDLIPDLVELEGTVSYGCFLDTSLDPFLPGVQLGMEIRAKLLAGFLGVRFGADAAVGMKPVASKSLPPPARDLLIQGQIHAMGSVVAVWALEADFDKTLRFEQRVPAAVGVFAVYTGLVPLPV